MQDMIKPRAQLGICRKDTIGHLDSVKKIYFVCSSSVDRFPKGIPKLKEPTKEEVQKVKNR